MAGSADLRLIDDLFAAIDAMDSSRFAGFLTEDATFRFGSAPAVSGRAAITGAVDEFFASIAGLKHDVTRVIRDGTTLVCLGDVSYRRDNGRVVSLPFADVLELDGTAFREYRIFIDIGPLFSD